MDANDCRAKVEGQINKKEHYRQLSIKKRITANYQKIKLRQTTKQSTMS